VTNEQILAVSIGIAVGFLAVLTGVLINNTRLNDVKDGLQRQMSDLKDGLRSEIKNVEERLYAEDKVTRAELKLEIADLRTIVEKQHSELLLKISELENRRVIQ
jgi:hypothetical protein